MEAEKSQEKINSDVKERDNIYVVELEMGDFAKEEIKVCFHDGYLVVVAENKAFPKENLRKAFYLGHEVAQDNIRAAFHNGILKCMIPKDEKKTVREAIEIEII